MRLLFEALRTEVLKDALHAILVVVMRYRSFRQGVSRHVLELLQKTERLFRRRDHTFVIRFQISTLRSQRLMPAGPFSMLLL